MSWLNRVPVAVLVLSGILAWGGAYALLAEPRVAPTISPLILPLPDGANVLPDFSAFPAGKARKVAFFDYMLPIIRHINSELFVERFYLQQWRNDFAQNGALTDQQRLALSSLAKKYDVADESVKDQLAILWRRVDTIPASLALAQAANESAYGTSRFAVEANNLFGQWCFSKGCGIVPSARHEDANHEVRKFASPVESVRSYMFNLNTNRAYANLRQLRSKQRASEQTPNGLTLVNALLKYSSRGQAYVEELTAMIRHNKLSQFDAAPVGQSKG